MLADLECVGDDDAFAFAGGCLIAAVKERFCDFDTRFAAGLWAVAVVSGLFGVIHLLCAAHGVRVLLGAPDGMLESLRQSGNLSRSVVSRFESARPFVIACFVALGLLQVIAGWFLVRVRFWEFLFAWCVAVIIAVAAVAVQLSVIWTGDGVPSEFYAILVQAAAIPALLLWSDGRHRRLETV